MTGRGDGGKRGGDGTGKGGAGKSPGAEGRENWEVLDSLRKRILEVDELLVALIAERRELVLKIGTVKRDLGLPILDPSREAAVVRRAAEMARERGLDEELTRDVIWRIIASAREDQSEI